MKASNMKFDDIVMEFVKNSNYRWGHDKKSQEIFKQRVNALCLITVCSIKKSIIDRSSEKIAQEDEDVKKFLQYIFTVVETTEWRKLLQVRALLRGINYTWIHNEN